MKTFKFQVVCGPKNEFYDIRGEAMSEARVIIVVELTQLFYNELILRSIFSVFKPFITNFADSQAGGCISAGMKYFPQFLTKSSAILVGS